MGAIETTENGSYETLHFVDLPEAGKEPGISPSTGHPRLPRRRPQSPMSTFASCSGDILDWGTGLATCGNTFVGARRPIDEPTRTVLTSSRYIEGMVPHRGGR
jgi:hypothetical protein